MGDFQVCEWGWMSGRGSNLKWWRDGCFFVDLNAYGLTERVYDLSNRLDVLFPDGWVSFYMFSQMAGHCIYVIVENSAGK